MIDELVIEEKNNVKKIAGLKEGKLRKFIIQDNNKPSEGNIYIGKITKKITTANGKQGFFVNIGDDKDAFINAEERNLENLVAHEGQDIIIQVQQEQRAEKGARLVRFITISGINLVYKPYGSEIEVSSKIKNEENRKKLYDLIYNHSSEGGWIIRTNAENEKSDIILEEMNKLKCMFSNILEGAKKAKSPAILYVNDNVIGDIINNNKDYLNKITVNTHVLENVLAKDFYVEYDSKAFDSTGVNYFLEDVLDKQVKLPCGGRLFIEETKAFVSIDVDSGEGNIQGGSGILNQEAAIEIARQIILRNLSGKIIVDFAGIPEYKFLKKSIDTLIKELSFDNIKSTVLGLTKAGNVEIIRSRRRPSLNDILTEECSVCKGTGRVEK